MQRAPMRLNFRIAQVTVFRNGVTCLPSPTSTGRNAGIFTTASGSPREWAGYGVNVIRINNTSGRLLVRTGVPHVPAPDET